MLKVTECGQQIKNITLLRQTFFEPVFDLRRSRQFAKAENKKIEGEVRKFPTSLDKKSLPCDKFCLCLCMIRETKLCYRNESQQNNAALQHCCDIVSNSCNIVPILRRCVALKIVVANRPV